MKTAAEIREQRLVKDETIIKDFIEVLDSATEEMYANGILFIAIEGFDQSDWATLRTSAVQDWLSNGGFQASWNPKGKLYLTVRKQ